MYDFGPYLLIGRSFLRPKTEVISHLPRVTSNEVDTTGTSIVTRSQREKDTVRSPKGELHEVKKETKKVNCQKAQKQTVRSKQITIQGSRPLSTQSRSKTNLGVTQIPNPVIIVDPPTKPSVFRNLVQSNFKIVTAPRGLYRAVTRSHQLYG